jgi:uncharacterized protein (TIGR03437 family)
MLGTLGPLCAQTGSSCIGPEAMSEFAVLGIPYSGQFVVNPGWLPAGPVTDFVVMPGTNLPPGLTFTPSTGVLAGTPTATGLYSIYVRVYLAADHDHYCGIIYPIIVNPPLSLASGGQLPPGNVGAGYLAWVAQNGAPLYTFKVTSGSLPPGLSFDAAANALTGTPLAQGDYSFTATVSDAAGESVTGQYLVTIGAPGDVYLTSAGVSFQALAGSGAQTFPVGVLTTDLRAVPFGVSILGASAGAAPGWLKVTPTSGATPAQLSVQADPGTLGVGTYPAELQITPQGENPITIGVTLNVLNSTVSFGAAPTGITVSYPTAADLAKTVTTTVQVWNNGGLPVSGTATAQPPVAGPTWLSITPSQFNLTLGQTQAFAVVVDGSKVSAGTHFGTITLKGSNKSLDIPVQVSVPGPVLQPSILVTPQAINWGALCNPTGTPRGGPYDVGWIGIQNPGPGTAYTVSLQGFNGGLQVQPTQGNDTARISLTINPCQLGLGRHTGYLEVSAPRMTPAKVHQKWEVCVAPWDNPDDFSCDARWGNPETDSDGLVMVAQQGQTAPVTAQITVTGSDAQPLQFAVNVGSGAPAGVSVYPTRGVATSTPTTVTVTADPTKLPAGVTQSGDMVDVSSTVGYSFAVPKSLAGVFLNPQVGAVGSAARSAARSEDASIPAAAACSPTQIVVVPTSPPSYFSQKVDWPTSIKARLVDDCGQAVTDAGVTASFSNGDPGLALALTDSAMGIYGATWRPTSPASSLTLTVRAIKTGLPMAARPIHGSVIDDPGTPIVNANGVVNNSNPVLGAPVAPGTVAAIYGSNLASAAILPTTVPLPTEVGGTQVLIGGIAAPLFYVSPGQIDVQIPVELPANSSQDVMVLVNGNVSIPQTIQLAAVNPGVAALADGRVLAQHGDYTLITPDSPARPEEWIALYLVGMGATSPAVPSNQASPSSPLAWATVQPNVTIDGVAAQVGYAGLTPGGIGLFQINCQVPKGARTGDLPLVVVQSDAAANAVTIPVAQ